ncbi:MAG TPA: trimethylamine methyltransferase family protein [Anaerolineae bacterium]|nr:trimethylamine methyltransferase family protein [Anaerolineae bacterium]
MSQSRWLLETLSEDALDQIEETAYRLLEEVGIALDHARAREMLHGLGCRVGGDRVCIPGDVVRWALDNVRADTEYLNRDGTHAFALGDGLVRFHNGGGQPYALDLETGAERPARVQDVADVSRLLDALPHVDQITPLFGPQDVPPALIMVESTAAMLRNTRKPLSSAAIDKPEDVPYVVEMAAACCGGLEAFRERPNMTISVSPVSPLRFPSDVAGAIIAVVQSGAPFHSLPAPSLGATGPVTMAGALAQQHAEVLASFVLAAATRPGAVVGYCSRISPIDLRTAISVWGSPEVGMSGACAAQLAHRLGFPCDSYGLSTTSRLLDPQFAYERLANALVPALAGVDILSGVGNGGGLVAGLEIAVIDDEIISLIKQIVAGCQVNETTLAYDVMREVIPRDGVFLGEMHTVRQMRKGALWIPGISTRGGSEKTGMSGGVVDRARARAREILSSYEVEPLSGDVGRHLDEVLAKARRELAGD